jgi:hypothetical protein
MQMGPDVPSRYLASSCTLIKVQALGLLVLKINEAPNEIHRLVLFSPPLFREGLEGALFPPLKTPRLEGEEDRL